MKYVGEIFKTKNCGNLLVTKYINYENVYVRFIDTGYETVARIDHIRDGSVRDKYLPTVYGIGVLGDEIAKVNGKHTKEYKRWKGMLQRCYGESCHKLQPTYKDCSVSENFKFFSYFKEWSNKQIGANALDDKGNPFALDKDILIKGNKQYGEDVCVFIPRELNNLVTNCSKSRGDSVIGVCYSKAHKKYLSKVRKYGKLIHLGHFDTEIEAFIVYKEAKESFVKEQANKWKGKIDERAYNALMNYEVNITD